MFLILNKQNDLASQKADTDLVGLGLKNYWYTVFFYVLCFLMCSCKLQKIKDPWKIAAET